MSDPETRRGGCLCGAVRFTVSGPMRPIAYCHCSQCRKQTGLYYAATNALKDALTIEGEDAITWYASSEGAARGFCSHCGSALFWQSHASPNISILAGSFDEDDGLAADRHIYVADKPGWYELRDELQKFPGAD